MWILIVIFAHLSISDGVQSSITTQEFQSKQTCEAGRKFIVSALGSQTTSMNSFIQNSIAGGTMQSPRSVILKVECTRK